MKSNKKSVTDLEAAKPQIHTIKKEKIFIETDAFKCFYKEAPCIEYIQTKPNSNLHLFAEDVSANMNKYFYAINYETTYLFSKLRKFHLYESYSGNEQLKLFLDIDLKQEYIPETANKQTLFDDTITDSVNFVMKRLQKYEITNPEIIVLKSSSDIKLSAHIIFPDVVFNNVKEMKFFMSDVDLTLEDTDANLINKSILDLLVYKKGCLRAPFNSKAGKFVNLEFYKSFNYNFTTEKELFMDCLVKNINREYYEIEFKIPENVQIIHKINNTATQNKNIKINDIHNTKINHPVSSLKPYLDLLNKNRTENYKTWLDVGMILYNCNPTKECFDIWDEWSKQSNNYSSIDYNAYKWNSFSTGFSSIASLKFFAKIDNPSAYPLIGNNLGIHNFKSYDFTSDYLLNTISEKIMENKSFVSKYIIDWMGKDEKDPLFIKGLAIRSPYNTGKTVIIKKIITEFPQNKRVLFVSYRQTLTHELFGNFKDINVKSYLDGSYHADRIIVQVESLHKLIRNTTSEGIVEIPSFDLVILDETESILNHFMSTTIHDKIYTFDLIHDMIYNSTRVLCLDGDFHNRSYDYLLNFGKVNVLNNLVKKDIKNFIFINNCEDINNDICEKLADGKNICIVSLSSKKGTHYYNIYENKYKCILHCNKSDDKHKKDLQNVNELWAKHQLVIYSPSIESGVNFSIPHFHKIYIVLSAKSTSPRGALQMAARIRTVVDNNIICYLNNMPFKVHANFYTYDEMKEYVCELYRKFLVPERKLNPETNKFIIEYNFNLYTQILIHNEVEKANKSSNLFVPYLIKLLTEKGHTYQYIKSKPSGACQKDTLSQNEIFSCDDIDSNTYNTLFKLLCKNEATREDKIMMEKYRIKKDWKIKEVTDEFLHKFYGKTYILHNLRFLLGNTVMDPYVINYNEKYNIVFDRASKLEEVKMIKEIIVGLGFSVPINGVKIDKDTFINNINKVISTTEFFVDTNKSQPLFGFDKVKIGMVKNSVKAFMGFMNGILGEWGMGIGIKRKSVKDENKKVKKLNYYLLGYIDNINIYI